MRRSGSATLLLLAVTLAGLGEAGHAAAQQPRPRPGLSAPGGPCAFTEIDLERWGMKELLNPPEVRLEDGRPFTLNVRLTNRDSTSIAGCGVTLRTYNGQLVGPTLRVRPGQTMSILLNNQLPAESPDEAAGQVTQEDTAAFIDTPPHSFNTTNLHTHGLHVSPVGNSDNVLLAIPPQSSFPYEIRVPANHTRGTYWYHAHAHGSTAIQVGSGMAGALIVDDDPATLPAKLQAANAREKVMLFSTILYDTAGRVDNIGAFFPDDTVTRRLCREGNPECTWQHSHRRVTINGQIVPIIHMRPGEVQRWRLIDGAFRETLRLRLEGHSLHEIATDGIYTGRIDTYGPGQTLELQPGYRSDVLVKAGSPGRYALLDDTSPAGLSIRQVAEDREVLAYVEVGGTPDSMHLPTPAEMGRLAPFPGVMLRDSADGSQFAVFNIRPSARPDRDDRIYFQINWASFDPARVRYLHLGATDQWTLQAVGSPHVFHIHVNPFQVQRVGPDGNPQWVWKDTQFVPPDSVGWVRRDSINRTLPDTARKFPLDTTVTVFSRYSDYIGQFVLHCHILDHEDLGMMEVVEIVGEDGVITGPASAHGGHGAHGARGTHGRPVRGAPGAPGGRGSPGGPGSPGVRGNPEE